jgi:hypothetical protein
MTKWKIYIKDRENLRTLLNVLLMNRETEITIRKNEGLTILVSDFGREAEVLQYAREELGNEVVSSVYDTDWRENVFLLNKPSYTFDSVFPFLIETSFLLIKGDAIHLSIKRYSTMNPFKRKKLGAKARRVLYRIKLFTPILMRDYVNRDGKQCLTFEKRNPLILTSNELSNLINGGETNGLLAL